MKKILMAAMGCLISLQSFANNLEIKEDKIYVSPGCVYVAPDAIYVNMDGNFIPVEGISVDANGIYIQNFESNVKERPFKCLKCGFVHTLSQGCPRK